MVYVFEIALLQELAERRLHLQSMERAASSAFRKSLAVFSRRMRRTRPDLLNDASAPLPRATTPGFDEALATYTRPWRTAAAHWPQRAVVTDSAHFRVGAAPIGLHSVHVSRGSIGAYSAVASKLVMKQASPAHLAMFTARLLPSKEWFAATPTPPRVARGLLRSSHREATDRPVHPRLSGEVLPDVPRAKLFRAEIRATSLAPTLPSSKPPESAPAAAAVANHENEIRSERSKQDISQPFEGADSALSDLGSWMVDYLERQMLRAQRGITGVDPRIVPV